MPEETNVLVASEAQLEVLASEILEAFPGQRLFAFEGPLGAGKTTFIKYFCRQLGISDSVASPTFAIVFEYLGENDHPVYHFDFYRIENTEEVYDLGYEEYFYSGHYCFIEWPGRIPELLPPEYVYIRINEGETKQSRLVSWELIKNYRPDG